MERKGYQPVDRLGGGEFGDVYLAKKGDKDYAVRVIKCTEANRSAMLRELGIISNVPKHDNILKFDWFPAGENEACVVMEYCSSGDLNQYLLEYTDASHRTVYGFMHQLAMGLAFLHSKGLVHRDLKPENILINSVNGQLVIKLSDFGLSKFIGKSDDVSMKDFSAEYAKNNYGTYYFMAPEVNEGEYDAKGDVFSLGLVCVAILCQSILTLPDERKLAAPVIDAGGSKQPVWQFLTNNPNTFLPQVDQLSHSEQFVKYEMASLIHYMLQKDPENRPPIGQVRIEVNRILYWDDVEDSSSEKLDDGRSSEGDPLDDSFEDQTLKDGEYECADTLPIRGDSEERDELDEEYEDTTLKRRSNSTGDDTASPQQRKKHVDDSTVRRARSAETMQDKSLNVHLVEFPDSCLLRSNSEFQYATLPDEHKYEAQEGQSSASRSPTSTTDTNETTSTPPDDSFIQNINAEGEDLAQGVRERLMENVENETLARLTPDEDDGEEVFRPMNTSSVGSESVESIPMYYPATNNISAGQDIDVDFDLDNIPIGENAGLATLVRHFSEASASSPRREEPVAPSWGLLGEGTEEIAADNSANMGLATLVSHYGQRDELTIEAFEPNAPFQSVDSQGSPTENDAVREYPDIRLETQPLLEDYETENVLSLTTVVKNLQKYPNEKPPSPTSAPNAPLSSLPLSDQGSSDAIYTTTNDLGSTTSLTSKVSQTETLNIVDRTPSPNPQSVLITDAEMNFCHPEDPEEASTIKRVLLEREEQRRLERDRQSQIKSDAELAQKLFKTWELEKGDELLAKKIAEEERRPSPSQCKPRPLSQTSSVYTPAQDEERFSDTQSLVSFGSPAPRRHRSRKDSEGLIAVVSELSDTESLSGVSNLKRTTANAPPLSDISTGSDDVEPIPSSMDDNTPWSLAKPESSLLGDSPYDGDDEEYDCIDPDHKGYCWWCTCCLFLPLTLPSFFFYKVVKFVRKKELKRKMKKQNKALKAS